MEIKHTLWSKSLMIALVGCLLTFQLTAQDDLLDMLDEGQEETTDYTIATFKTTRILNGHSIETNAEGVLMFVVGHRFGRLSSGINELFGLDNATIRLGFEYGVTDNLDIGIGRNSFEKTLDGFAKYKLLRQSTGKRKMPVTMTALATMALKTNKWAEPGRENFFSSRLYYSYSLLVARKFNKMFSFQLAPMLVHRNLVASTEDANDVFVLGVGWRAKLSGSLAVNLEYHFIVPGAISSKVYGEDVQNALSLGVDIETGGHVFQVFFTNSRGTTDKLFATETTGDWLKGDIHIGFNITRVFTMYDAQKKRRNKGK